MDASAVVTHLVLVLGMHRSGTSLVAKSLECLGVSLGDDADWTGPDNPSGFFESQAILAIDNAVMARYGAAWDSVAVDLTKPVIISDLTSAAQRILAGKLERFPLLAIKDPRLCRLLPFWRPILHRIGCTVSVVTTWRGSGGIAQSLAKRNGMPEKVAMALCDAYEHDLREGLRGVPWKHAYVSFASMQSHPETEVRFIGNALGLGVDERKLRAFCDGFVRRAA